MKFDDYTSVLKLIDEDFFAEIELMNWFDVKISLEGLLKFKNFDQVLDFDIDMLESLSV